MRAPHKQCYDRQLNPISMRKTLELYEDPNYRNVQTTKVNGVTIRTVWTGTDCAQSDLGPSKPMVFQTMIDGYDKAPENPIPHERLYVALSFHAIAVARVMRGASIG